MKTIIRERPILFSGPMVRAIIEGRKTQTRRVIKPQPDLEFAKQNRLVLEFFKPGLALELESIGLEFFEPYLELEIEIETKSHCPYGKIGDRLWIRETWAYIDNFEIGEKSYFEYRADSGNKYPGGWPEELSEDPMCGRWKPSIHMPRKASRITLEIEDIRVERLRDISLQDAKSEGIEISYQSHSGPGYDKISSLLGFRLLWEKIHGIASWNQNPWVWVIEFKVIEIKKGLNE